MLRKNIMTILAKFLLLSLLSLALPQSFAVTIEGFNFSHHDWEVACDNTGTCRAAGYHSYEDLHGLSVLLTRKAGKATKVTAQLKLALYDEEMEFVNSPSTLSMTINNNEYGQLNAVNEIYFLSIKQASALIKALSKNSKIVFSHSDKQWTLSDKGAAAVLLKMDDFQQRLNTREALIRKGNKDESQVLKAKEKPVIKKSKLTFDNTVEERVEEQKAQALFEILKASVSESELEEDSCSMLGTSDIWLTHLDKNHSLVSTLCWRAAYNGGSGYWLMNSELTRVIEMITENATSYENGLIDATHKGRGLGDCWAGESWVWDGKAFVQSKIFTTGMCRMIELGGTWNLPTMLTRVVDE